MSEADYQLDRHLSKNLPYAGTFIDRPDYNPNTQYEWREATVKVGAKTVRPAGQKLIIAICPEDPRFCFVKGKKKGKRTGTIRTDALELD